MRDDAQNPPPPPAQAAGGAAAEAAAAAPAAQPITAPPAGEHYINMGERLARLEALCQKLEGVLVGEAAERELGSGEASPATG